MPPKYVCELVRPQGWSLNILEQPEPHWLSDGLWGFGNRSIMPHEISNPEGINWISICHNWGRRSKKLCTYGQYTFEVPWSLDSPWQNGMKPASTCSNQVDEFNLWLFIAGCGLGLGRFRESSRLERTLGVVFDTALFEKCQSWNFLWTFFDWTGGIEFKFCRIVSGLQQSFLFTDILFFSHDYPNPNLPLWSFVTLASVSVQ